jgi:hypothetical protein
MDPIGLSHHPSSVMPEPTLVMTPSRAATSDPIDLRRPEDADMRHRRLLASCSPSASTAIAVRGDEILKSCLIIDSDTAIVRCHRKYGNKPGVRTVTLQFDAGTARFELEDETFLADKQTRVAPARIVPTQHVMDRYAKPAPTLPFVPKEEVARHKSFTFHVRSRGDHRVIAACDTLRDAKRIAGFMNGDVYQFRFFTDTYDDSTLWNVA